MSVGRRGVEKEEEGWGRGGRRGRGERETERQLSFPNNLPTAATNLVFASLF